MIGIIALGLSILVILSGLYLHAKTKKDALGNLYLFSSYSAIAIGVILFVGTIVGGACMMRCHKSMGHSSCYSQEGGKCSAMSSCSNAGNKCAHMSKAGCAHGQESCSHAGGASCGHGGMRGEMHEGHHGGEMHKEIIIKKMDTEDDEETGSE